MLYFSDDAKQKIPFAPDIFYEKNNKNAVTKEWYLAIALDIADTERYLL